MYRFMTQVGVCRAFCPLSRWK